MTEVYGDSTIAMSAHNLLVATGGPLRRNELLATLRDLQHPDLTRAQLQLALDRLVQMKLIRGTALGYQHTDRQRRLIISRNLDDVVRHEDGTVGGGWTGWMRKEHRGGLSMVFDVEII